MHPYWKTDTLAQRLRALADELESAERYGLPLPRTVMVTAGPHGSAYFAPTTANEFDEWADYTEATVSTYDHDGKRWESATADVNGLRVEFSFTQPIVEQVTA